jgi:hypothetical protein
MELFAPDAIALVLAKVGFLPDTVGPYVSLMLAGFFVGTLGHLSSSKWLATIGIVMVFLGALGFPLVLLAGEENRPAAPNPGLNDFP